MATMHFHDATGRENVSPEDRAREMEFITNYVRDSMQMIGIEADFTPQAVATVETFEDYQADCAAFGLTAYHTLKELQSAFVVQSMFNPNADVQAVYDRLLKRFEEKE